MKEDVGYDSIDDSVKDEEEVIYCNEKMIKCVVEECVVLKYVLLDRYERRRNYVLNLWKIVWRFLNN